MPSTDPEPDPGPAPDEAAELAALRRRVAELEAASGPPAPRHHRLRSTGAVLLIVLASVLSLLAVLAVWLSDEVTDTDRFVATMAPLARDPQVQSAVSDRVSKAVLEQIDVPAVVNQLAQAAAQPGVPPQAAALIGSLSGPIGNGLTALVGGAADSVVSSDAFADVWTGALRTGHAALVKALTGQGGGAVQLTDDQVTIDVGPAVDRVKTQLVDSGFTLAGRIPTVHTQFTVFASPDLAKVRSGFRLLQLLGVWVPVVAALVAAAGVLLAANRRRALCGAALGVAAAMLVLGVALAVFRSFFLDHLPAGVSSGAAGAVYDALVHYLRNAVRSVGALAVLVALGAFFVGPSRAARTVRSACGTAIAGVRSVAESAGFRAGPVGPFVARFKRLIGIVILLGASAVFLAWDDPTGVVVFWFAVVILALFGVREFLAPGPGAQREASEREG
ncbi:hypothetical protein [Kitasatospora sp. LaBMicrA B282]|uniref:hypothetical protein n=1 Tax=Kitasatospora sp. LaBMicrA B282 TaxID=3420949 RepID=UPI003D0E6C70